MKINFFSILILLIIIKSFVWMFSIPIFQAPDEAVHFSFVQRIGEKESLPDLVREGIISREVWEAAEILHFNWGRSHPVWQKYDANWREKIGQIPESSRKDFSKKNDRGYKNSPLFYYLAYPFYKLAYNHNFLTRFYIVRFFSMILSFITIFTSYKIAEIIFKKKLLCLATAAWVAFQPMYSFISASVNNDNLIILLTTTFLYFSLKAIEEKKIIYKFWSFVQIILGVITKPQAFSLFFAYPFIFGRKAIQGIFISLVFFIIFLISSTVFINKLSKNIIYTFSLNNFSDFFLLGQKIFNLNFFSLLNNYLGITKTTYLNNLFPWYWGVFGWLEVTMPLLTYRVLKILIFLAMWRIIYWLAKNFRKNLKISQYLFFLIVTIVTFSGLIILNDFCVFVNSGKAFGIQGRYFLPLISGHMILLIFGLNEFIPKKNKKIFSLFLIIGSIFLNIIGFLSMYDYFYG